MADIEVIQNKIYEVRGVRVMLDFDLAILYGVENKRLKEQVRRNIERFPADFMLELSKVEWKQLVAICDQIPENLKHSYASPYAFTEQGVAMLSGILRSQQAIEVNISIMRAFVQMRQFLIQNRDILKSIDELKQKIIQLEQSGDDTLAAINDLSEDTRKEIDDIYIALAEMASKKKELNKPNRIGFVKD